MSIHVLLVFPLRFEESAEFLKGVVSYQKTHQRWNVSLQEHFDREESANSSLRSRKWDGVITSIITPGLVQLCADLNIPLVDLSDAPLTHGVPSIRPDNFAIGKTGAQYFLARKFSAFAFCGFSNCTSSVERRRGYVELLKERRHHTAVLETKSIEAPTPFWDTKQVELIASWLRTLAKGTAIMACSDTRAFQVIRAGREAELHVPEDVAILGANNESVRCELSNPSLSSIAINFFEAGHKAAELLESAIQKRLSGVTDIRVGPTGIASRASTDVLALRDRHVATALKYIQEFACENISVDHVLRTVPTSRSQLEHKFRRFLGRSPQVEIRRVQVAKICQLLKYTELPLKDIAQQTGFVHVEYLCVVFKRIMGCTPTEFRRQEPRQAEPSIVVA